MPETGGYQSASQMTSICKEQFGEVNVNKVFLTMPKRSLGRIRSFLRLLKEEGAQNAEGFFYPSTNDLKFIVWYIGLKLFNFRGICKVEKILRQADFIVVTGFLETSIIDQIRCRADKAEFVFNHAGDPVTYNSKIKADDLRLVWDGYLGYMRNFSKVLFQSELQMKSAKEIGLDSIRCCKLLPTCNEEFIKDQLHGARNPFESGFSNIVNIGTLQERKNQELILELAENLRHLPYRFYLIGDNTVDINYTLKLKKKIKEKNLDNVYLLGHRSDYILYVNYCDIVMNVSKFEGVSRVLRESLYLSKILICTKILGNMECIEDGSNGFLCGFNVNDLIDKISIIRNMPANEKIEFELRSKLIYQNKYSLDGYKYNVNMLFKERTK
jgi:glycosyltransferase involved in cell wall biosynthesis